MSIIVNKFFVNAFAVAGDVTVIPDPAQSDGSISYQSGFGINYELELGVNPAAIPVPRSSTNELFYQITLALQQYQAWGTPNFISTSDNLGAPFPYSKYALALYDDGINGARPYQSLVNSNTALPTDPTKWKLLDSTGNTLFINNVTFDTTMGNVVANGDAVYFNSTLNVYSKAAANNTQSQEFIGFADVTNKRVYAVGYANLNTLGGLTLTAGGVYYLSATTAGQITNIISTSNVKVGIAISTNEMWILPTVLPVQYDMVYQMGANQPIAPGVYTKLLFDIPIIDRQSIFNLANHYAIIKEAGDYVISGLINMVDTSIPGVLLSLQVVKNGGTLLRRTEYTTALASTTNTTTAGLFSVEPLGAGDTIELQVWHNDNISQNTNTGQLTAFSIYKLPTQT